MAESTDLTPAEIATNFELSKHCRLVAAYLHKVVKELLDRADAHDLSKFERPEVTDFAKVKPLADMVYMSKEYTDNLQVLDKALGHHYSRNDHHPQHFKNGINDMNLLQLIEMLVDWAASSQRHNSGNLRKSIEHNADRFGISPQLTKILENTAPFFES